MAVAAGGSALAHHSYTAYQMDRIIEVEGVLEDLVWVSPHSLLKVRADDGRLYTAEWRAPAAMLRVGVQRDTLRKGDRIVIAGNPHRELDENGVVNLKSVKRPADGWSWPAS